jgi:hypothetical protein
MYEWRSFGCAGYTLHGVSVDEPDRVKRAAIFRKLVA